MDSCAIGLFFDFMNILSFLIVILSKSVMTPMFEQAQNLVLRCCYL